MIFWFKNKIIRWNFIFGFVFNLALWFFLYWQFQPQIEPVYLRYSVYFGVNLIGPWWHVFYAPGLGLLVLTINYVLILASQKKNRFASYFLAYASSLIQLLLAVCGVFLVMINR